MQFFLKYLETLGLSETHSTFHKECHDSGYPLPPFLSTYKPLQTDFIGIKQKDVDFLIKCFDEERNHDLLDKWESIVSEDLTNKDLSKLKLNVNLRIYAYITIPHRKRVSRDDKQHSLQLLLDYFKSNIHEEISDTEILSLYALPYVPDPLNHPIFCKFFKKSWIVTLRDTLRTYCMSLCQQLINPVETTDIGKLYMLWSHTSNVMNDCLFDIQRNPMLGSSDNNLKLVSLFPTCPMHLELPKHSPFRLLFDSFYKLKKENDSLSQSTQKMKDDYLKKIRNNN
jgi:hypothetical protein